MEQKFLISNKSHIEKYLGKLGGLLIRKKFQVPSKAGSLYRNTLTAPYRNTIHYTVSLYKRKRNVLNLLPGQNNLSVLIRRKKNSMVIFFLTKNKNSDSRLSLEDNFILKMLERKISNFSGNKFEFFSYNLYI